MSAGGTSRSDLAAAGRKKLAEFRRQKAAAAAAASKVAAHSPPNGARGSENGFGGSLQSSTEVLTRPLPAVSSSPEPTPEPSRTDAPQASDAGLDVPAATSQDSSGPLHWLDKADGVSSGTQPAAPSSPWLGPSPPSASPAPPPARQPDPVLDSSFLAKRSHEGMMQHDLPPQPAPLVADPGPGGRPARPDWLQAAPGPSAFIADRTSRPEAGSGPGTQPVSSSWLGPGLPLPAAPSSTSRLGEPRPWSGTLTPPLPAPPPPSSTSAALPSAASSQAGSVAGDNPHQPADGVASSRSRRAAFADLQAHIAELTEERFALQRGLAQQAQQAATVTAEHESMVQAFNQQGAVVEALQHEVSALREQLAEAMAREESLAQHRDALTHAATAAQERAQDLAMEVVALEESLLQHKSATLKQGVEEGAAAGTAARLQTQLMSSERQRHDLEEDLRSIREENAALKDQLRAAFAAKDEGVAEKQAVGVASRSAAGAGAAHETDHAGILSAPDPPVPETGEAETARTTRDPLAPRAPAPAPTHGPGPPPGLPRPEPELRQGSAALPAALELLLPRYTLVQAEEGGLMESEAVLETVQSIQGLLTSLGARQGELLAALRRKEEQLAALQTAHEEARSRLARQQAQMEHLAQQVDGSVRVGRYPCL
ncbi:hypothetical protein ACKKBG_A06180 [Auxenochlorella protothecoides x Auxenochlorella symbiontica]